MALGTPFNFLDPVVVAPGLGAPFNFLDPIVVVPGLGTPFNLSISPGFQKRGSFKRVKQIEIGGPFPTFVTTLAELPSAVGRLGSYAFVTDETGGPVLVFSDNLFWRRWTDRVIAS